jgi:hypothetical protein
MELLEIIVGALVDNLDSLVNHLTESLSGTAGLALLSQSLTLKSPIIHPSGQ